MLNASRLLSGLAILLAGMAGCEPALSENELGNVIFEIPMVSEGEENNSLEGSGPTDVAEAASEPGPSGEPGGAPSNSD